MKVLCPVCDKPMSANFMCARVAEDKSDYDQHSCHIIAGYYPAAGEDAVECIIYYRNYKIRIRNTIDFYCIDFPEGYIIVSIYGASDSVLQFPLNDYLHMDNIKPLLNKINKLMMLT